jgi:predicted transposase YbfD/YdcC
MRRKSEYDRAQSRNKGHGRIEVRTLESTTALKGYLDWPGLQQVCLIKRTRTVAGKTGVQTVCAVTSLSRKQASAKRLLTIARDHWRIENCLHWVRDVSFGEDQCRVRSRAAPQILAAIRNADIFLLCLARTTNAAAALRRHAARPAEALALVKKPPEKDF